MSKPILIGITGGTGSGKSTIADALYSNFSNDCIAMIQQDMYYKDQSHLSMEERVKTNYDHPMAFDNDLLVEHLKALINGESIEKPSYDFTVHNRAKETTTVEARDIILVEGYKNSNLRKIEVYRDGVSDRIITQKEKLIVIASDTHLDIDNNINVVNKDDVEKLVDLIEKEEEFKFENYQ